MDNLRRHQGKLRDGRMARARLAARLLAGVVAAAVILARVAAPARATTPPAPAVTGLTVTRFDDPAPGACAVGDCSLREAVIAANNAAGLDIILLPSGSYTLTLPGLDDNANAGDLDLIQSVIISTTASVPVAMNGASLGNLNVAESPSFGSIGGQDIATIGASGGFGDRIFHILVTTTFVTMTNVIIQQGITTGINPGGGVRVDSGSHLRLENSTVRDNHANGDGGGIVNLGTLVLVDSLVRDNTANGANGGGGIQNHNGASLSLLNSQVVSNSVSQATASGGGLLMNQNGTLTMTGSQVLSNSAGSLAAGGGLLVGFGSNAKLTDVTVAGNHANSGSGIFNQGTITLTTSHIHDNTGGGGGGLFNGHRATLVSSEVISNIALPGGGGGLENITGATLTLTGSVVLSNTAGVGGGLKNEGGGTTVLTNTVLAGNTAGTGGGIYNNGGVLTMTASAIVSNTALFGQGGGLYVIGTVKASNTTFSGNNAQLDGGGLYAPGALTLNNVTIANNRSIAGAGGGISTHSGAGGIRNTLIGGNLAATSGLDCDGTLRSDDYNLIQNAAGCAFLGPVSNTLSNTVLAMGPLELFGSTWAHALLGGGPALDAGDDVTCLPIDQRGASRPAGAHCDIGAFEGTNGLALRLLFLTLLMR